MLLSTRWIRDYVDIGLTPRELAERLTMAGLEVDAIHETAPSFTGTVVAKILSIKPHPEADRLSLCKVTTGQDSYPVVCGAGNIRPDDVVPLAKEGATIPGGITIKRSVIRGEVSEGMLCSEKDLGLGEDTTGVMILPANLTLGCDLTEALDLKDTIFDIGITPNRADCLSIIGVAREIAAITGGKLRYPASTFSENGEDIHRVTGVEILDPDLCPRYSARVIRKVMVKPSPLWMRLRLEAVGIRPINNIVDVTNFVMMELGQPLHAFDYNLLEGGRIVVRRSQPGEIFTSLDGKERNLPADTVLICDSAKPVAIGGIMGGLNSEVRENTEAVLLESAYFNPSSIRRSAKTLGMVTESSFRFERGIDPMGVVRALNRAAGLIADLSGGQICKSYIDRYPKMIETIVIPLRPKRVKQILGTAIDRHEMGKILKSLEMTVNKTDRDEVYQVTSPTFRVDITREIDLIEEIARLYGYDHIPVKLPHVAVMPVMKDRKKILEDRIRGVLVGYGYSEVINYSFISPDAVDILALGKDDRRRQLVRIKNPLTEDQSVMRTTILHSLLKTYEKNTRNACLNLKIFEIGKVFFHQKKGELPIEESHLGCLLAGLRYDDLWHFNSGQADFYDLKGCVENLFDHLKIAEVKFKSDNRQAFLHPGRSCSIYIGGQFVGFLGEVHPNVLACLDLRNRVVVFDIHLDVLTANFSDKVHCRDVSRFPSSSRDVAFLVRETLEADEMINFARGTGEELLEKIHIFDIYTGEGISEGMKSLGLRFSYRSSNRTLTDVEVNQVHSRIVKRIAVLTGAKIRGEEEQIRSKELGLRIKLEEVRDDKDRHNPECM